MTKEQVVTALYAHVNQRSGIDSRNYSDRENLMGDCRPVLRDGKYARQMLRFIDMSPSITVAMILEATRAFSGRLQIVEKDNKVYCDYTTGQYFPTEYRAAACSVLAACLWAWFRANCECDTKEKIQKAAKRNFGRGIASRWFN